MAVTATDALRVAEILRQAAPFGEDLFKDVYQAFQTHHPDLVPAQLPERSDTAIAAETDRLIRERFPAPASVPPK
jgi:hypothetical protein